MNFFKTSLTLIFAVSFSSAYANKLDTARAVENKTNAVSASSQKKIDKSSQTTISLKAEIEQLQEEVNNLEVYRNHLAALIDNQSQEVNSLNLQMEEIKHTRQGIVPLMYRMIAGLTSIVENDRPIKRKQREERVAKLQIMMNQANVSDAEKYRRILEAYQIEMDYGIKLGVYQGQVDLSPLLSIEADILYLGRISLIARNLNQDQFWAWNDSVNKWQVLDPSVKPELDKAFDIASKIISPSLIYLPVSVLTTDLKSAVQMEVN